MRIHTAKRISKLRITILKLSFVLIIGAILSGSFYLVSSAADASKFKAGNIMSDSIFTSKQTMTASTIQTFLNNKVPSCDTNGTRPASEFGRPDLTRAQYAASRGWQAPPYTCLKDYKEGGVSSSQIIYNVAQEFNINPQVLIVLLQKEQSLVTDTWPLNVQYRSATGYACPDNAPCDSKYYGLVRQLTWAATMFHTIVTGSQTWSNDYGSGNSWYTPYSLGVNSILWSPTTSCGDSSVTIENRATVALYSYTPYRPNQASLEAGYGDAAGDCDSHGNRNFYLYFSDWFGSTLGTPTYQSSVQYVKYYSDANYTSEIAQDNLERASTVYVKVAFKNTGNQVWYGDLLRLGTSNDQNRASTLADGSWINATRPANPENSVDVLPGQTATFAFSIQSPSELKSYSESFAPLLENLRWISGSAALSFTTISSTPFYDARLTSVKAYLGDQTTTISVGNINRYKDESISIEVKGINTGNVSLPSNYTRIATTYPRNRTSTVATDNWTTASRPASLTSDIPPGQQFTLSFSINTAAELNQAIEKFGLVVEGSRWISDDVASANISIVARPPRIIDTQTTSTYGDMMLSSDEKTFLRIQQDGNLVLYSRGKALWSVKTQLNNLQLTFQQDGNLVLYSGNTPIWASRTYAPISQGSMLVIQDDGNLVIYANPVKPIWSWRTGRLY